MSKKNIDGWLMFIYFITILPYLLIGVSLWLDIQIFLKWLFHFLGLISLFWVILFFIYFYKNKFSKDILRLLLLFPIVSGPLLFMLYLLVVWSITGGPGEKV